MTNLNKVEFVPFASTWPFLVGFSCSFSDPARSTSVSVPQVITPSGRYAFTKKRITMWEREDLGGGNGSDGPKRDHRVKIFSGRRLWVWVWVYAYLELNKQKILMLCRFKIL